eukprot:6938853-Ditylum_brightwellii.AAC.1
MAHVLEKSSGGKRIGTTVSGKCKMLPKLMAAPLLARRKATQELHTCLVLEVGLFSLAVKSMLLAYIFASSDKKVRCGLSLCNNCNTSRKKSHSVML